MLKQMVEKFGPDSMNYYSLDPEKVAAGISTLKINPDSQPGVYYNLQGQRVENPVKGVYIKNGKKIIYK